MSETNAELAAILQDYVPRGDYETALQAIEDAVTERDEFRAEIEELRPRAQELEKKHRARSYRDAFEKVRKGKVRDDLADDAFRLLELAQDADEPDEGAIGKALDGFLKDRKHYSPESTKPREIPAGEGHSRGSHTRPGEPEMRVKRTELANALWMRENQGRVAQAQKAGLLVIDDD